MTPDPLAPVRRIGARLARQQHDRDATMVELRDAIRTADAAGVPRAHIAAAAGVTRQTVYTILGTVSHG